MHLFGRDGNVSCPDCSGDPMGAHIDQNSSNCTSVHMCSLLYRKHTIIKVFFKKEHFSLERAHRAAQITEHSVFLKQHSQLIPIPGLTETSFKLQGAIPRHTGLGRPGLHLASPGAAATGAARACTTPSFDRSGPRGPFANPGLRSMEGHYDTKTRSYRMHSACLGRVQDDSIPFH